MRAGSSSNDFTQALEEGRPVGPPLIGALLRIPWETVRHHMLARLRERGVTDLDAAHLTVFQYPGPQAARPSELAFRLGISKQALNYLLGQLERLDYLERRADPDDRRSKRIVLTHRGESVVRVIREAVTDLETRWEDQLGAERFGELRALLLELNRHTPAPVQPGSANAGRRARGGS